MKKERAADFTIPCLFLCVLILSFLCTALAQNDYPPVQGKPDAREMGQGRLAVPAEQAGPQGTADIFTAPQPPGNEGLNRPDVPAGDAEEKYTGTEPFSGIAGTGITETGPEDSR